MKCPHCGKPVQLVAVAFPVEQGTDEPTQRYLPVQDLEHALSAGATTKGEPLLKLVDVIDNVEGKIVVQAVGWLDKTDWNAINKILKSFGARWVSVGKESHWEVPT